MTNWYFAEGVENDYLSACQHYAEIDGALGLAFIGSFSDAINDLLGHPYAWPVVEEDIRRHLLRRFPYGIYYVLDGQMIGVVGFEHMRRAPKSFRAGR